MSDGYEMDREWFRLLHASDLHLGTPHSWRTFENLLVFCGHGDVDLVIFAGDLFDSNRITDELLASVWEKLSDLQLPLLILPGNHDCYIEDSVYRRKGFAYPGEAIRIFTDPKGETFRYPELGLAIWGRPLGGYSGNMHPLAGIPPRGPERWQIAVAHGQVVEDTPGIACGFPSGSGCSFPITTDELVECERDYVALGHWPTTCRVLQGAVTAYYSGSVTEMGTFLTVGFTPEKAVCVRSHHL